MSKTVLIVEDEYYFRQALKKYIDDYNEWFTVCGEAGNGRDGLEMIRALRPDIALVDITMPILDGISMIERVAEELLPTKVIILTGYSEFEYAQKAIRLQVLDYILKPIRIEDLYRSLETVAARIDQERAEGRALAEFSEQNRALLGMAQEHWLEKLLSGEAGDAEWDGIADSIGLPEDDRRCRLVLVDVQIGDRGWQKEDWLLYYYAVRNVLGELLPEETRSVSRLSPARTLYTLVFLQECSDNLRAVLEAFRHVAGEQLGLDATATISGMICNPDEFEDIRREAETEHAYHLMRESRGVFAGDMGGSGGSRCFGPLERRRLSAALLAGNGGWQDLIHDIFGTMKEDGSDPEWVFRHAIDILTVILDAAAQPDAPIDLCDSPYHRLLTCKSATELEEFLLDRATTILEGNRRRGETSGAQAELYRRAYTYLEDHFSDPHLNLEKISGALYVNSQYLCKVFKRHSGETIGGYLSSLRMDHARQLLEDGAANLTAVAGQCGFTDANYFGKCFKRCFGIPPSRFIS